jgi:hypothetical protein
VAADDLAAWVAAKGQLQALQSAEASEVAVRAASDRVRELAKTRHVVAFETTANERNLDVTAHLRKRLEDKLRTLRSGGTTTRFNVTPFALFR